MVDLGSGILFDCPPIWKFAGGHSIVTGRREVIIFKISTFGDLAEPERSRVRQSEFSRFSQRARDWASEPTTRIIKEFSEDEGLNAFRCASVISEALVGDLFFGQAVVEFSRGVLFVTYEAPFTDEITKETFYDLLKRLHEERPKG